MQQSLWLVRQDGRLRAKLAGLTFPFGLFLLVLLHAAQSEQHADRRGEGHRRLCLLLSGLFFTVIFSAYSKDIQRLYFWDLTGAALGCLILIPFLPHIGPAGALFLGGGLCWITERDSGQEVLIIGAAGGQETKAALTFGAKHVDVVELVGFVVKVGKELYKDFNGGIFNDPRVTAHVDEGRSFLRQRGNVTIDNLTMLNAMPHVLEHTCGGPSKQFRQSAHRFCARMSRWSRNGVPDRIFAQLRQEQMIRINADLFSRQHGHQSSS
ncbi:MAG: spermine/spermidine synthase domain-containing protein [Candidatus Electronema sp. VV]